MEAPGFCILRERQAAAPAVLLSSGQEMDIAATRKRPTGAAGGQQRHINTHPQKEKQPEHPTANNSKYLIVHKCLSAVYRQ